MCGSVTGSKGLIKLWKISEGQQGIGKAYVTCRLDLYLEHVDCAVVSVSPPLIATRCLILSMQYLFEREIAFVSQSYAVIGLRERGPDVLVLFTRSVRSDRSI